MYPANYYYNPGFMNVPGRIRPNILSSFNLLRKGRINWGSLLNNANKTLNVVDRAIPIIKEARPLWGNMKSMLKVASLFKEETSNISANINSTNKEQEKINTKDTSSVNNSPNFFV